MNSIEPAYKATFEWIWTDTKLGFTRWLEDDNKAYWISGKPGSGKSTMMKHIYQRLSASDHRTINRPIFVAFCFHNRGSHMQKSFEGLLCSILHQVLTLEPRLVGVILPLYLERKNSRGRLWVFEDLMKVLLKFLEQDRVSVMLYLFLDALDEYDGPPTRVSDFVQSILDMPNNPVTKVKICFSSRLWNNFVDRFQSLPGFKMDEQTKTDVKMYVRGCLHDNPSTDLLLTSIDANVRSGVVELELGIIQRAKGVFLWLKLVMDEVIQEHAEGSTLKEIAEIISLFPKDLEELYAHNHTKNSTTVENGKFRYARSRPTRRRIP